MDVTLELANVIHRKIQKLCIQSQKHFRFAATERCVGASSLPGRSSDLDRVDEEERLKEGEEEGGEPAFRLSATPVHAVEHQEEGREAAGQEHQHPGQLRFVRRKLTSARPAASLLVADFLASAVELLLVTSVVLLVQPDDVIEIGIVEILHGVLVALDLPSLPEVYKGVAGRSSGALVQGVVDGFAALPEERDDDDVDRKYDEETNEARVELVQAEAEGPDLEAPPVGVAGRGRLRLEEHGVGDHGEEEQREAARGALYAREAAAGRSEANV